MSDWRPIESAPRETEVLIYCPGQTPSVFTAVLGDPLEEWICSVEGRDAPRDDYFGDKPKRPTHWMPLPEPPAPTGLPSEAIGRNGLGNETGAGNVGENSPPPETPNV